MGYAVNLPFLFIKAITQLGDNHLAVRLGGLYVLERIARDSASDHGAVMEVLTAFVREASPVTATPPDKTSGEREIKKSPHEQKLPSAIQAILTVIGLRTRTFENGEIQRLDLCNTNLQGADLSQAKNLTQEQINMACVDEHTKLLGGLTKPPPCPAHP